MKHIKNTHQTHFRVMKKIYPKKWLELHPYKQTNSVDQYYVGIANEIHKRLYSSTIADAFEEEENIRYTSLCLAAWFEDVISQTGIWQAFTFGPSLLDRNGNPKKNYNIAASHLSDLSYSHPRAAIGMVAPGHFVFVLVDGREMNGSKGADFPTLSEIMKNEGCSVAYNLDGGRSAVMVYDGQWVNAPYKNGRGVSDILYISKAPVLENKEEHA